MMNKMYKLLPFVLIAVLLVSLIIEYYPLNDVSKSEFGDNVTGDFDTDNNSQESAFEQIKKEIKPNIENPRLKNNLVKNAGFDKDLSFWKSERHPENFNWISNNEYRNGIVSVKTIPPKNPDKRVVYEASLSQCVVLDKGRRYRFSALFKAMGQYKAKHANRVNLYWYQSEDCTTQGQFSDYLEPAPDSLEWQHIEHENRLRSLNARSALIRIVQSRTAANNQEAFWDDIELSPTEFEPVTSQNRQKKSSPLFPVGHNYIKNGQFTADLSSWRYGGDTQWIADEYNSENGMARLAIFSDKGGYGAHSFSQCINIGSNTAFEAKARVRIDPVSTQKGGGIFRLSWYENENCDGRSQAGFKSDRIDDTTGWQNLVIDRIEAPDTAQSARLNITRGVQDSGLFAYFIDEIYFKSLAEYTPPK